MDLLPLANMERDEINIKLGEMNQWQKDHGIDDLEAHKEINARFDVVESNISLLATKEDVEKIVRDTLLDVLFKTGRGTKFWLLTAAAVIGSLLVIAGGLKTILAWLGFNYIGK